MTASLRTAVEIIGAWAELSNTLDVEPVDDPSITVVRDARLHLRAEADNSW
jgi:hypothetical protein